MAWVILVLVLLAAAFGVRQSSVIRKRGMADLTEPYSKRIDLAARELADVSERLQAAANALRDSV